MAGVLLPQFFLKSSLLNNNSFSSKEEESVFLKDHDGTKNVCIFMMILNFILVKKKNQNQVTYNNKTKTQYIFWGAITC